MGGKAKTEKMSVYGCLRNWPVKSFYHVPGRDKLFFHRGLEHYIAYRKQRIALEKGLAAWKDESHPDLATPGAPLH